MTDRPRMRFIQGGDRAFTHMLNLPFVHTYCGAASALVLCAMTYFFLPVLERSTAQIFTPKGYTLFYQHVLLAALLALLVWALARLERIPLNGRALGLSFRMPRERRNFVLLYVTLMALASVFISLFIFYLEYKGALIHQVALPLSVERSSLHVAVGADGLNALLPTVIPHAICMLILAPFIEEVYITGIVFPALRNRLGFVVGACLTASIFALFHPGANLLSDGNGLPFALLVGGQIASFTLYQGTRSLYPSIASHALRNFTVFFLELSALV